MFDPTNIPDYEWNTLKKLIAGFSPILVPKDSQKESYAQIIRCLPQSIQLKLRLTLKTLSFRGPAAPLTLSHKLIVNMSDEEVFDILKRWSQSQLTVLKMFVNGLLVLSIMALYRETDAALLHKQVVHPHIIEMKRNLDIFGWKPPIVEIPPPLKRNGLSVVNTDVAIVGSGCSAMVSAYLLTKAGFRVLLVEKGTLLTAENAPEFDSQREKLSYERGGVFPSLDGSILTLAGATVGGGGAINWSCSLRTPESIRNEWIRKSGAKLFGSSFYDHAMDEIERIMGVTYKLKEPHSFTNQLILDSSEKLGYPAMATGQNTGSHHPNTAFLEFGKRHGEQGGIAEFLRYAFANGAQLMQGAYVKSISHSGGVAKGLHVAVGGRDVFVSCKRVVCGAGSLHTPALLKRSGFKNKLIGEGLKLHPVTVAYGQFNNVLVNKRLDPIMTAVTTQVDNIDGEGHGPKIEAIHHQPHLLMNFLPWRSRADYQEKLKNLPHLSSLLIITRDKSHGRVVVDKHGEPQVEYTTSPYDLNALKLGSMCGANLLYMGGADRIILSSTKIPDFVSKKPKSQRSIWDSDYREWLELCEKVEFENYDTHVASAHQMSSCRMGAFGPSHSPVDERGHLYECKNVHVIDTSVFPTASGVNPMISCMSVAYVLSLFLAEDLRRASTKL